MKRSHSCIVLLCSNIQACVVASSLVLSTIQTVHAEALPIQPGSWTLAVLPDTQDYTEFGLSHFTTQTQWLADHAVSHNIKYVLHEGDVTEHNNTIQWDRGLASLSILDGVVPYAVAPGNHDYGPNGFSANRNTMFNDPGYFGTGSPYANQASIGEFFEAGKTDNSYHTFNAGGEDWLVFAMEWAPRDSVLTWANEVVENHPDHQAMLVTHAYMYYDDTRYDWATKGTSQQWNPHSYPLANNPGETVNDGQEIWDKLISQHENFKFTFSGHVIGDGTGFLSSVGDEGNVVHQMLSNYQFKSQGGNGDMRLLEFLPDGETVIVRTYSPVLDRYDTADDQQFTINLNEIPEEPQGPPIIENAVAANLVVGGSTTNANNSVGSVTVAQSSLPGIETLQLNRGDYELSVGGDGMEYTHGILLASITQNVRDGLRATVEAGRNGFNNGLMALSLTQAGSAGETEVNFNTSVAWFDLRAGWLGAHVNANGSLASAPSEGIDPSMVSRLAPGRYSLDLGVDSQTDGLLFAIGNNNSTVVVQTAPHADGSGWDLRVQNNATEFSGTGLDRNFSFLYLPYDTEGLIGGLYEGASDTHVSSSGSFSMTRLSEGEYELTIPSESPETGMLLLTVSDDYSNGFISAPNDNVLTYEPTLSGTFLINSIDLPGLTLEDSSFSWAFISFDDPITLATSTSADFNGDGTVDGADFLIWQRGVNSSGGLASGDADNSGFVDGDDLAIWQAQYGTDGMNPPLSVVPEPTALLLIVMGMLMPNRIR